MRRLLLSSTFLLAACDGAAYGTYPPEDPGLVAANEAAGDPHRGRFPKEAAYSGLSEGADLFATIVTDEGAIHCDLLEGSAPLSVANFVGLARGKRPFLDPRSDEWTTRPYYDGLTFHRAMTRIFVQGGRIGDTAGVGFRIQDEPSIGNAFDKPGVLALANEGRPNTSAAQFFLTTEARRELDGRYTIIGRCEDVKVIRALERRVLKGERPVIETVRITRE